MNELVYLKNDEAVCDSLQVAERFEKRHADVIRAIENLIKNDSTQNCVQCFKQSFYKDETGKKEQNVSHEPRWFYLLGYGIHRQQSK